MRRKMSHSEAGKLGAAATQIYYIADNKRKLEEYNKKPKYCQNCPTPLLYDGHKRRKFCSQSCAAIFNNRKIHKNKTFICLTCEAETPVERTSKNKYCSNQCQQDYAWMERKKLIELGLCNGVRPLRRYLIEKFGHICHCCKNTEWQGKQIPLEMEHKDGHSENNILENLSMLCPNCHAQTPTYKAKNKGNGRHSRKQRYKDGKSY